MSGLFLCQCLSCSFQTVFGLKINEEESLDIFGLKLEILPSLVCKTAPWLEDTKAGDTLGLRLNWDLLQLQWMDEGFR